MEVKNSPKWDFVFLERGWYGMIYLNWSQSIHSRLRKSIQAEFDLGINRYDLGKIRTFYQLLWNPGLQLYEPKLQCMSSLQLKIFCPSVTWQPLTPRGAFSFIPVHVRSIAHLSYTYCCSPPSRPPSLMETLGLSERTSTQPSVPTARRPSSC